MKTIYHELCMVRRETGDEHIISARPALELQLKTDSGENRTMLVPEEASPLTRAVACIMLRTEVAVEDVVSRFAFRRS